MQKIHAGLSEPFGHAVESGDVIGCFIDVNDQIISKNYCH